MSCSRLVSLAVAGTSCLVLERMEDPHSPLFQRKAWMGMRGPYRFLSVDRRILNRRGMF